MRIALPNGFITLDETRQIASRKAQGGESAKSLVRLAPTSLKTLAKDALLAKRRRRFDLMPVRRFLSESPHSFIWQYHSLFFNPAADMALAQRVPVVQFVDAPQVWEARKWGVKRRGWGNTAERIGELPSYVVPHWSCA